MGKNNIKVKLIVFTALTALCVWVANISCYACWPWRLYQPKAPDSLIR